MGGALLDVVTIGDGPFGLVHRLHQTRGQAPLRHTDVELANGDRPRYQGIDTTERRRIPHVFCDYRCGDELLCGLLVWSRKVASLQGWLTSGIAAAGDEA